MARTLAEAAEILLRKAQRNEEGCLITATCTDRAGYGRLMVEGTHHSAHRVVYAAVRGPIPPGLHIDHVCHSQSTDCAGGPTCRHRPCIAPEHLEAVTHLENVRRGVRPRRACCFRGHEYTDENTYRTPKQRICRTCNKEAVRRYKERQMLRAAGIAAAA